MGRHELLLQLGLVAYCSVRASPVHVTVSFKSVLATTTTTATFQNSVNPLYRMDNGKDKPNPIGPAVFELEAQLKASYVRHSPWFPYPRLACAELVPGGWNFTLIDPIIEAFMGAHSDRPVVLDFATIPQWMWHTDDPVEVPEDPDKRFVDYEQGSRLAVPVETVANYFSRVYQYYMRGGFTDDLGRFHKGYNYSFDWIEVLNEPDFEHGISPSNYIKLYDAIVNKLHAQFPSVRFIGLSLGSHGQLEYYRQFLDASQHSPPSTPVHAISYHLYVDGGSENDTSRLLPLFLARVDEFVQEVEQVEQIRQQLRPAAHTFINEIGCAYGGPFDVTYWLACSAMFAYVFGQLAPLGIQVLGQSQMIGFDNITDPDGNRLEDEWPSTSMVDWTDGSPNPRYWTLKMLIDSLGTGVKRVVKVDTDGPDQLYVAAFITEHDGMGKVLLINKTGATLEVSMDDVDDCMDTTASLLHVDGYTDRGPYVVDLVEDTKSILLSPWAIGVLWMRCRSDSDHQSS